MSSSPQSQEQQPHEHLTLIEEAAAAQAALSSMRSISPVNSQPSLEEQQLMRSPCQYEEQQPCEQPAPLQGEAATLAARLHPTSSSHTQPTLFEEQQLHEQPAY